RRYQLYPGGATVRVEWRAVTPAPRQRRSSSVPTASPRLAATATEANAPEGGSPVTTDRPAPQGPPHRPEALAAVQHCTGRDPDPKPPRAPAEAAARAGPSELP